MEIHSFLIKDKTEIMTHFTLLTIIIIIFKMINKINLILVEEKLKSNSIFINLIILELKIVKILKNNLSKGE
jgi:hypothetical protein